MKSPLVYSIGTLSVAGFVLCLSPTHAAENFAKPFSDALDKVNAQCPQNYPDAVTAIPEPDEVSSIDTQKLLAMLENWNPSLRKTAATELGNRGEKLIPALEKGTRSKSWKVRAGSASALAAIIKQELQKPGSEADAVIKKYSSAIDEFTRLSKDPHIEVRRATFEALTSMAPQTKEATMAMLTLCIDEDEYIAQMAMIYFEKKFSIKNIPTADVIPYLREALKNPLPRGHGHAIRLIQREMDEKTQRKFIPDLIAHLKWQPTRDTMFAASGQAEALKLITQWGVTEIIPDLPDIMLKRLRGQRIYGNCLDAAKAFGKDAVVLLPKFKVMLADIEKNGKESKFYPNRDSEENVAKLRDTIAHLEKL